MGSWSACAVERWKWKWWRKKEKEMSIENSKWERFLRQNGVESGPNWSQRCGWIRQRRTVCAMSLDAPPKGILTSSLWLSSAVRAGTSQADRGLGRWSGLDLETSR